MLVSYALAIRHTRYETAEKHECCGVGPDAVPLAGSPGCWLEGPGLAAVAAGAHNSRMARTAGGFCNRRGSAPIRRAVRAAVRWGPDGCLVWAGAFVPLADDR